MQQTTYTLLFMAVLSFICALILSTLASALKEPKERAKELDRSKEMLIAAGILNHAGYFQIQNEKGESNPAVWVQDGAQGRLKIAEKPTIATQDDILQVYRNRISPFLVNDKGQLTSFQQAGLNEKQYVQEFKKTGYYKEPYKLIYKIFANGSEGRKERPVVGYVIPVNGMGLWDAIYGYLAIENDGDTVIGISWYDQKETPGLGANIAEADWQSQFRGKKIFQQSSGGKTDFQTAPLGITVVKGRVREVLANSPKANSAVDGMAGATLTGNGVMNAYRDVLAAYRPFLLKLHQQDQQHQERR